MTGSQSPQRHSIPVFREINDFLAAAGFRQRTRNPHFFAIRLEDTYPDVRAVMPPFRKEFFLVALATNQGGSSEFLLDEHLVKNLNTYLVFQSPGHVLSWRRDEGLRGYLLYFREDCFSFFRNSVLEEFPFFGLLHTNFFQIESAVFNNLKDDFEGLLTEQERSYSYRDQVIYARLLALLYRCKSFYATFNAAMLNQSSATVLAQRYQQLINNYFLEKRTVEEYAGLLHVSAGHLNDMVKRATGKNASAFITEKLLREAKNLIVFTRQDITQIAYELNFASPAHFNRFFKKGTGLTPLAFRREFSEENAG